MIRGSFLWSFRCRRKVSRDLQSGNQGYLLQCCDIFHIAVRKAFPHRDPVSGPAGYLQEKDLFTVYGINDGAVMITVLVFPVLNTYDITDAKTIGRFGVVKEIPVMLGIDLTGKQISYKLGKGKAFGIPAPVRGFSPDMVDRPAAPIPAFDIRFFV